MCRREVQRLESEATRSQDIIKNYKSICSDLSYRLEKQQDNFKILRTRIAVSYCWKQFNDYFHRKDCLQGVISQCEQCSTALAEFTEQKNGSLSKKVRHVCCSFGFTKFYQKSSFINF